MPLSLCVICRRNVKSILERAEIYKKQMLPIRELLADFCNEFNWEYFSRGRTPHVSVFGKIGIYDGVLDIWSVECDWDILSDQIDENYEFDLFCHAYINIDGESYSAMKSLFWRGTFRQLPKIVPKFLAEAKEMLREIGMSNEYVKYDNKRLEPDTAPNFGKAKTKYHKEY